MDERASDAERELASERLRTANAEGRIEVAELEQRLDLVHVARTRADLDAIVHDLPEARAAVIRRERVQTDGGSATLDLRDLHSGETCEVHVRCRRGAVVVRVPAGTRVTLEGVNRGGSTAIRVRPHPEGPLVRLHQENERGSIRVQAPRSGLRAWRPAR